MQPTISYDRLVEKWAPVLNEESAGQITDAHKKAVTAAVLENQEIALREEGMINEAAPNNSTGNVANWNPVLIALVRRAMPNLMAYDICGVQPMSGPTGLIFSMKSRYMTSKAGAARGAANTDNTEALFNEALANYSGDSSTASFPAGGPSGLDKTFKTGDGVNDSTIADSVANPIANIDPYSTAEAEALGDATEALSLIHI